MFRKRIFAYLLILVSTILFSLNYIFEWFKIFIFVMSVHYILIAASIFAFLYLFPKHKKIVLAGCFCFCLIWNFIFTAYLGFIMESGRGFDLDNCYHLFHVGGWIDYISMDLPFFIMGITAVLLLTILIVAVPALSFRYFSAQRNRQTLCAAWGIVGLFIFFFCTNNPPCKELFNLIKGVRSAQKYFCTDAANYQECGIKLTPVSWTEVQAEKGKNLVYIILESTENTFLDQEKFPGLLPQLSDFRKHALSFTNVSCAQNSFTTSAAMFTAMTGFYMTPLHLRCGFNKGYNLGTGAQFSSFPRILHQAGYEQIFLVGHSANFARTDSFVADQKYDRLWEGIKKKRITDWTFSVRDSAVYEQAWCTYQELAKKGKPFNLTLLTIDAHGPDGFYSPEEPAYPLQGSKPNNLFNAMYASDVALGRFLERLRRHPAAKDTCIVITNDHLAHEYTNCTDILKTNPRRRLVFMIENSVKTCKNTDVEGRTFDIAPTILDAMGVKHDYRFPLGESLFGTPDPRRLQPTEKQQKLLTYYTIMKSSNMLKMPLNIQVAVKPYPLVQINQQMHPLLLGEANDLPGDGEGVFIGFNGNIIDQPVLSFRNESEYKKIKRKKFSNCIIVGKVARNQTGFSEKEWGKFYLKAQINGKEKIIFKDQPVELALIFR